MEGCCLILGQSFAVPLAVSLAVSLAMSLAVSLVVSLVVSLASEGRSVLFDAQMFSVGLGLAADSQNL